MPEEGFLRRWARLKAQPADAPAPVPVAAEPAPAVAEPAPAVAAAAPPRDDLEPAARPAPTLDDVARLTAESDYSTFVARGVDKAVQRMALKKLFADPHFNVMDGLDIYIDDYNKVTPLPEGMLASLKHAPGVLARLFDDAAKARQEQADAAPDTAPNAEPGIEANAEPSTEANAEPTAEANAEPTAEANAAVSDAAPPPIQGTP